MDSLDLDILIARIRRVKEYNSQSIKKANEVVFDKMSAVYAKRRRQEYSKENGVRLLEKYRGIMHREFKQVDRFLDVGCGLGQVVLNLSLILPLGKAHGIDISLRMLKECRENAQRLNLKPFLSQGDIEYFPYKDNSFDLIIGHAILHHLPKADLVFKEVYRLLKSGGICIFTEPTKKGGRILAVFRWLIWSLPLLIRRITKSEEEKLIDIRPYSPQELEEAARLAGFSKVRTEPFAGFISRIFYWMSDPIMQRTSNLYIQRGVNRVIDCLLRFDEIFSQRIIPKSWFDEMAIILEKD